ncbi:unnamed protein product [Peronospora belbahrii]|uniref:Uncharacterized protein n=1 Tax=Peronospora belbahrii TaxID=622444 RepID=A0AAU9KYU8_9STRA|nr:unnamed protein product [Peronospora belbahrii]CAH0518319.1 unnamed protein product [Peronospora belbahrii]
MAVTAAAKAITTQASTITNNSDEEEVTTAEFSVDLTDNQTWAINFYECAAEGDLECLEEILDSDLVGVNDVDVDGFTALMVAAAEGHRNVVETLLQRGADINICTHELRSTALHFAAKSGDAEIVNALCEVDAKAVDAWNVNADTPLIWACIEGCAEAVKVLLKHGANVNVLNQYGASTLMCAVMMGEDSEQEGIKSDKQRAEILTMLLEKNGKLVNFQDREGSSAMHLAASCGYLECVKTLLAFGAEITLRNVIGQTPLEEAQDSELRESGPCVEYLRGIWRQLEEEAAARMMAMLEMEEKADKSASGGAGGPTVTAISKKSKKKNKKAKRKAAAKQHQQVRQEDDPGPNYSKDNLMEQQDSHECKVVSTMLEPVVVASTAEPDRGTPTVNSTVPEAKDDKASSASSDEDEDAPVGNSVVSSGSDDDRGGHNLEDKMSDSSNMDEQFAQEVESEATPSAGAWTTVGKKHRSAIAAITNTLVVRTPTSLPHEKMPLSTVTRQKSAPISPFTAPHASRRNFNHGLSNVRERRPTSGHTLSLASAPSIIQHKGANADVPARKHERRWGKTSVSFLESRSILSSSLLNPDALAFGSVGLTTGSTETSNVSSCAETSGSRFPTSVTSPWRSPFYGSSPASCTAASSSSVAASLHYTGVGHLTWKHQRANGNHQGARETRDRWVSRLRLSNESVAETLGYLACGLCGELVNDNLQCNGDMSSRTSDGKTSSICTQLYCASCLESPAFRAANTALFKCVRCHEVISKDTMTCNSFAQAQAASLGLSMPNSVNARNQDDIRRYTMENMQRVLEVSDSRISAVDLHAFHLVPGSDLSTLSNGQLEVLESVHQLALVQIVEQRLANARALERLQMEEGLKMQQDVLQFIPR